MDFLGKMASILGPAAELKNSIYEPVKRELDYLLCYDDNVKNVRDETRKLEDKRAGLQLRIEEAENNARVVLPEVESWLREVTHIQNKMDEIETEIATIQNGGFSRSLHRRSVSKKVEVIAEAMKELQKSCVFEIISVPPPPAAWTPIQLGSAFEFESRKYIEEGVMASLRAAEVYKVGICGMGGVGKTTMAKRITHRARDEHLFEEIVMVVVSQNADMPRIQDDIARSLGLHLGEGSLHVKAHLLCRRLSESTKRCLIVIDDVWGYLNLNDLGMPSSHSGCKVLITSRNKDIFSDLNVNKIHEIDVLSEDEAWNLFKLNVGSCIDHPDVVSVARQVLKECKGLPIALVTVGATLKNNKDSRAWNDLLHQLKSSNPIDLPRVLHDVYKPLRLSYKFLESKRAKSLFLLCCLFPEDHNIPLDELTFYAMGLGILKGINKLEEARNRVCSLVETLKGRFLLLEGYRDDHVRMHDVVRDVAVFIASHKKLIRTHSNDGSWISPYIGGGIGLHAGSRVFPNLQLIWIDGTIDSEYSINDGFFEEMKELNVLSIRHSQVPRIPKTTRLLENLQTLVLVFCESLESITAVGELVNLKILVCRYCDLIESLPMETGRLSGLKSLELSYCKNLKKIGPGIISKLKELEELIVWKCFDGWEAKNMGRENENALLSELEHLSSLRILKIVVKDSRLAAEQIRLSPNLMQYHIRIGDPEREIMYHKVRHERKLKLKLLKNISLGEWIYELIKSVEFMHIEGYGSVLDFGVAHNMRGLVLKNCSTAKTLMSAKTVALLERLYLKKLVTFKEMCDIDGPMSSNSFNNLQELQLEHLPGLEHLNILSNFNMLSSLDVSSCHKLSSVMTRRSSLVQLKTLTIYCCKMIEQVLLWDEEEDPIVFQNLEFLQLNKLPNLTSFSKGIKNIGFPVLEEMRILSCARLKSFVWRTSPYDDDHGDWICILCKSQKFELGSLRELRVGGYSGSNSICRNWCPMITAIFSRLSDLHVSKIRNMKSLFPYSVAQNLHNLTYLWIEECDDMVVVIEDDACGGQTPPTPTPLLPNLVKINLWHLKKLKRFCECKHALEFPSLKTLKMKECDSMEEFTSGHVSTPFLPHITTGLFGRDIVNISNGVNATLKQEWVKRQQLEELNSRLKPPIVEMVMEEEEIMSSDDDEDQTEEEEEVMSSDDQTEEEDHNSQEEEEEGMMSSNDDGDQIEEVQKRVEEVDAWLSIGPPNESQLQNLRLIRSEEEQGRRLEGSPIQQKMKAPIEITVQTRVEEFNAAWLSIGPPNKSQLQNLRSIEEEEEHIRRLEGSSLQQNTKAPVEIMVMIENKKITQRVKWFELKEKNVEERHSESMFEDLKSVEESRKRHTGISIALENEFQPEKRRRIGTEVEHSERSSLLEHMKARTETMVQNVEEVINHLDSTIEKWRKRHAELSIVP